MVQERSLLSSKVTGLSAPAWPAEERGTTLPKDKYVGKHRDPSEDRASSKGPLKPAKPIRHPVDKDYKPEDKK